MVTVSDTVGLCYVGSIYHFYTPSESILAPKMATVSGTVGLCWCFFSFLCSKGRCEGCYLVVPLVKNNEHLWTMLLDVVCPSPYRKSICRKQFHSCGIQTGLVWVLWILVFRFWNSGFSVGIFPMGVSFQLTLLLGLDGASVIPIKWQNGQARFIFWVF